MRPPFWLWFGALSGWLFAMLYAIPEATRDAFRMAELVEALDGWISRGGFLPEAWAKGADKDSGRKSAGG